MASLDTNVLVRYLVRDDSAQTASARKLIDRYARSRETLHVPVTVALELEWVLRSRYAFDKVAMIQAFTSLLSADELAFESSSALEIALFHYGQSSADYADCLHVALARTAGRQPWWTFDRPASTLQGARLLDS